MTQLVPLEPLIYLLSGLSASLLVWNLWVTAQVSYKQFQESYVAETEATLTDVFSSFPPERVFHLSLLASGAVFLLIFASINWIAGLLFAGAAFYAPRMFFAIVRDRRRATFDMQLIDGLELLSSSIRAGLTLPQAMELLVKEMKPPITQEFGRVLQEHRLGEDFDKAMLNSARRMGSRDLDMLVNSVMITRRTGGNVGEMFQTIAGSIRERVRLESKVRALAATGNLQAMVMAGMPFGMMLALWFIDPSHVQLLFSTTLGLFSVGAIVLMVVAAFIWIRNIMDLDI